MKNEKEKIQELEQLLEDIWNAHLFDLEDDLTRRVQQTLKTKTWKPIKK